MKKTGMRHLVILFLFGNLFAAPANEFFNSEVYVWIQGKIKFNATFNKSYD